NVMRLDDRALLRLLRDHSRRCEHDDARHRATAAAFLGRKAAIGDTFRHFVRSLRAERADRRDPAPPSGPAAHPARTAAIGAWQRFVIDVLHDRAVVPYLKVQRAVLARRDAWLESRPTSGDG